MFFFLFITTQLADVDVFVFSFDFPLLFNEQARGKYSSAANHKCVGPGLTLIRCLGLYEK